MLANVNQPDVIVEIYVSFGAYLSIHGLYACYFGLRLPTWLYLRNYLKFSLKKQPIFVIVIASSYALLAPFSTGIKVRVISPHSLKITN